MRDFQFPGRSPLRVTEGAVSTRSTFRGGTLTAGSDPRKDGCALGY